MIFNISGKFDKKQALIVKNSQQVLVISVYVIFFRYFSKKVQKTQCTLGLSKDCLESKKKLCAKIVLLGIF